MCHSNSLDVLKRGRHVSPTDTRSVQVTLPAELFARVRVASLATGKTPSAIIRRALVAGLDTADV